MNKFVLVITLFAILYEAVRAQTSKIEIRESNGALSMCTDALLSSITTNSGGNEGSTTTIAASDITGGSGTGLAVTVDGSTGATAGITTILVTTAGSGYQIGDVLTIAASALAGGAVTITLQADDFAHGELKQSADALLSSITTNPASDEDSNAKADATLTHNAGVGHDSSVTLSFTGEGTSAGTNKGITGISVTKCTRGFKVGDTITIASGSLEANSDAIITIQADDLVDSTRTSYLSGSSISFRDSVGANLQFAVGTKTGYYLPLSKSTKVISVGTTFNGGTVVPEIDGVTDSTVVTVVPSRVFNVEDGMNILNVVTSTDGTFQLRLIKPDDELKVINTGKRSIEIAYNPASVGEFTCSAFTGDVTDPTDRAGVKGGVTKSVRTHNILPENIFNSVQVTLNGLTPFQAYELHCYHFAHGIISKVDPADSGALITTDKASLTSVSITTTNRKNKLALSGTDKIVLTFTHEKSLVSNDIIKLSFYDDFDTKQVIKKNGAADVTDCTGLVAIKSISNDNSDVTMSGCASSDNDLSITLSGTSTVTGTGTVMEVELNYGDALQWQQSRGATTKVTFDLDVTGHGPLRQQEAWETIAGP